MADLILASQVYDYEKDRELVPGGSLVPDHRVSDVRLRERDGVRSLLKSSVVYQRGISTGGKVFETTRLAEMTRLVQTRGRYLVSSVRVSGGWRPYERVFADTPYSFGLLDEAEYRRVLGEHFDVVTLSKFAPLARYYKIPSALFRDMTLDADFVRAFAGCTTAANLTASLFGVSRVRSDLVKAVAQASWQRLVLAWALRGPEVPTDWLVTFLRRDVEWPKGSGRSGLLVRGWVRHLDVKSRRRLLLETGQDARNKDEVRALLDTVSCRAPAGVRITSVRSWSDLHRQAIVVLEDERRVKREADRRRSVTKERRAEALRRRYDSDYQALLATPEGQAMLVQQAAEKAAREKAERERTAAQRRRATDLGRRVVDAFEGSPYRVEFTCERERLEDWGRRMGNCIAGYTWAAVEGKSLLLGFFEGDELVANAEIASLESTPRLTQLLGRFNRHHGDHEAIASRIARLGVATDNYWGDDR